MALYIGVSNVARKVKSLYVGVNGVARKVKKLYVGVNNIARKIFPTTSVEYIGTATNLSENRVYLAAASNNTYALFAGGGYQTSYYSSVDVYNKSLTLSSATSLSYASYNLCSGAFSGSSILFAGGRRSSYHTYNNSVAFYSASGLTKSSPSNLLPIARSNLGCACQGYYVIGGGMIGSGQYTNEVTAYNGSGTRFIPYSFATAKSEYGATVNGLYSFGGRYSIFAGGYNGSYFDEVEAFNTSLTKTSLSSLSSARGDMFASHVGSYALFAGGYGSSTYYSTVDTYNASLTKSTATDIGLARCYGAAASNGNCALFAGGYSSDKLVKPFVDIYDTSLTRSTGTPLSAGKSSLAGTALDKYILFGGGTTSRNTTGYAVNTVDVYEYNE